MFSIIFNGFWTVFGPFFSGFPSLWATKNEGVFNFLAGLHRPDWLSRTCFPSFSIGYEPFSDRFCFVFLSFFFRFSFIGFFRFPWNGWRFHGAREPEKKWNKNENTVFFLTKVSASRLCWTAMLDSSSSAIDVSLCFPYLQQDEKLSIAESKYTKWQSDGTKACSLEPRFMANVANLIISVFSLMH